MLGFILDQTNIILREVKELDQRHTVELRCGPRSCQSCHSGASETSQVLGSGTGFWGSSGEERPSA